MSRHRMPIIPTAPHTSLALTLTEEEFQRLRDILAAYSGVYLDASRQRILEAGLTRRLAATDISLAAYEQHIRTTAGREELRKLAELVLNHETFFFRNKPHMRALQEVLLPEIKRRKHAGEQIRLWSAGCATGEEAYSLAILLLETFGADAARTCEVWATDMSHAALARARTGFFQGRALKHVSPERLAQFFRPQDRGYVVNDQVRALVQFDVLNLLDPFPQKANGVDFIFCQNVMIYFQLDTCRDLLERFDGCMADDGLLFLGFSETLWNVYDGFHAREVAGAYVYAKAALPRPSARRATASRVVARPQQPSANRAAHTASMSHPAAAREELALLAQGKELLNTGHSDAALTLLRRISPQAMSVPQALLLIARLHADRGDLDLAVAEVQRAIEIDPLACESYLLSGILSMRQEQWLSAVHAFEKARYLDPSAPLVSFHLAEAYSRLGNSPAAIREYRATLWKLHPFAPEHILDGVAVSWLRDTCERQLDGLQPERTRGSTASRL